MSSYAVERSRFVPHLRLRLLLPRAAGQSWGSLWKLWSGRWGSLWSSRWSSPWWLAPRLSPVRRCSLIRVLAVGNSLIKLASFNENFSSIIYNYGRKMKFGTPKHFIWRQIRSFSINNSKTIPLIYSMVIVLCQVANSQSGKMLVISRDCLTWCFSRFIIKLEKIQDYSLNAAELLLVFLSLCLISLWICVRNVVFLRTHTMLLSETRILTYFTTCIKHNLISEVLTCWLQLDGWQTGQKERQKGKARHSF